MSERDSRHPDTIDEVIDRLDGIIQWAAVERSRIGYFAALSRGRPRSVDLTSLGVRRRRQPEVPVRIQLGYSAIGRVSGDEISLSVVLIEGDGAG